MIRAIVLFDIDGTLLLTGGAGGRSLNAVFEERYDIQNAFDVIKPHGMTDPAIVREMIERHLDRAPEPGEVAALLEAYVPVMRRELEISEHFRVLPGVPAVIAALREDPTVALGLATGNLEATAALKVQRAGLGGAFTFGGYGSDAECRRTLTLRGVERGRAIGGEGAPVFVVGDTVHDAACAAHAGVQCLAVLTSDALEEDLRRAGAAHVLPDLTDLDRVLDVFGL